MQISLDTHFLQQCFCAVVRGVCSVTYNTNFVTNMLVLSAHSALVSCTMSHVVTGQEIGHFKA